MSTLHFPPNRKTGNLLTRVPISRGLAWGIIILCALVAFEIFNFSTTQFALLDVFGNLSFAGMRWATILAIAFCGIDFAGIARLFTPQQGRDEPAEVWYLFGAWLLAAGMNACLTWWGVSVAMAQRETASQMLSASVISPATLKFVPVFVAIMVWLIRVLIIGTFSIAGESLFSSAGDRVRSQVRPAPQPVASSLRPRPAVNPITSAYRPAQNVARPTDDNAPFGDHPS
ncbi:hypothetical protein KKB64_02325 [Patescibacteria group bacterium]|nr:hypothetical protein [Patescibacteria group bacterium]MBU1472605.1 hypothetical protein [Patescibacteria group bacterium]MBU2459856.1 hypothetical protein [Patescibacteria group bacterium]MBU2544083.1 hypothetical protein [Patescibacteria group bacterium]